MGVCIQCDNEALKDSDYCAVCEEREFKKIRSWLFVPAIGLLVSLIAIIVSINTTTKVLMEHYSVIGTGPKALLIYELVFYIAMFAYTLFVCGLFFRKKRQLPRFYIGFLLIWLVFYGVDLLLAHYLIGLPFVFETVKALIRNAISAAIWVPYFLISGRVKRTFVR
ncbi:Protein of unknown function [Kosakonia radicincitans]|uniref:DUF2569 domain-containing protein n=1 Tax=Kosakonia radicincitans TaxID=283686 RepID=UPI0009A5D75D|nr:DUF2569 domain-containing protein [Kosakonia radicincitans]SKC07370.1 Protein of unknown function [Kosakonia radicincitans]